MLGEPKGEGHPQEPLRPGRDGYGGEIGGHLQGVHKDPLGMDVEGSRGGTCGGR